MAARQWPRDILCHMVAVHARKKESRRRWPGRGETPRIWRTMLAVDQGVVALAGKLTVTGTIPAELRGKPLLLAANHIGVFDALVLMAACRKIGVAPRFMLAGGLLDAPVLGTALRACGHLRVDRADSSSAIDQFGKATEALRTTAAPILVYPEGRISHDPGLWPERGKTGAARLALAAGVPVVPISQWGAHEAVFWGTEKVHGMSDLVPLVRSGLTSPVRRPRFQVHFGDALDLSDLELSRPGTPWLAHSRIMQAIANGLIPLRAGEFGEPRFHDPTRPTDGKSPWKPATP